VLCADRYASISLLDAELPDEPEVVDPEEGVGMGVVVDVDVVGVEAASVGAGEDGGRDVVVVDPSEGEGVSTTALFAAGVELVCTLEVVVLVVVDVVVLVTGVELEDAGEVVVEELVVVAASGTVVVGCIITGGI